MLRGPLTFSDIYIILHNESTTFQLKIKEGIQTQWERPTLNHYLYRVNLKLSL